MEQILTVLAGQPNCGKSTIFNMLTGARQYVANYPGVTVEKKAGSFVCGGKNSVLGVKQEIIIKKFIDNMPARFEYDPKEIELNGVVISVDQSTGKAQSIQRVSVAD